MYIPSIFGSLVRPLSLAGVLCLSLAPNSRADAPEPTAAVPTAATPIVLSVDPAASSITYHMVHKLHKFAAVTNKIEGKVHILHTGAAQVAVRARVESFDSGNSNRDAHMKEATEAARFPMVEFKGVCEGCATPTTFPSTVARTIKGELSFHGVKKVLELTTKLTYESDRRIHATAQLTASLDEFKVERPSLLFAKVDDSLKLDVDLVFRQ